jgi:hypothetical protein
MGKQPRPDRVSVLDAPLERWTGRLGLRPFAEYHYELITGRNPNPALSDQTPYIHRPGLGDGGACARAPAPASR